MHYLVEVLFVHSITGITLIPNCYAQLPFLLFCMLCRNPSEAGSLPLLLLLPSSYLVSPATLRFLHQLFKLPPVASWLPTALRSSTPQQLFNCISVDSLCRTTPVFCLPTPRVSNFYNLSYHLLTMHDMIVSISHQHEMPCSLLWALWLTSFIICMSPISLTRNRQWAD